MLQPRAPSWAPTVVAVGGGVLAGVETLVELRPGPVIALMCAVALLFTERRAKNLAVFVSSLLGTGLILWFAAGQGIGNVGPFLSHGLQIIAGYRDQRPRADPDVAVPSAVPVGEVEWHRWGAHRAWHSGRWIAPGRLPAQ